ncbi:calcium-binding protein [Pseudomonas sp. A34-9]|uniref:calcium-binding protein n=1 Tax=Pseudomonas sp. A34-9 TaxID=3034675 RepID=UPI00240E22CC|nr:calcium-binding protein [Pseudomonas sp. A34-9]
MAIPIEASTDTLQGSNIQVTEIDTSPNAHAPPAGKVASPAPPSVAPAPEDGDAPYRRTLKALDKHFGPSRIGEVMVNRAELKSLGATVNGHPISPANAGMQTPDQGFLDGLNFDSATVKTRLKSVDIPDSGVVATLFYEIACKRSYNAAPLFIGAEGLDPGSAMDRLNKLGTAAQKLDIHRVDSFQNTPGWVSKTKSYLMSGTGVGLQAFGIYSGYRGMLDAVKNGDAGEAIYQGGSIAAEFGSLIIEQGLRKGGEAMLRNGSTAFGHFSSTSAGKFLSRGAGLFASAITMPFDIVDAVKSFNAAADAKDKVAQDHYVNGAVSVAGAGVSLVLGVAALAGFGSVAGPLGLAAAAVLIFGSMIYHAARAVDDIDDYIELSAHERLRSGWFACTGQELDKEVMDRFKISKTFSDYDHQLRSSARAVLEGAYKDSIEHVVNGSFKVVLKDVQVWRHRWNESAGEKPFKLDSEPVIVGTDDVINARDGLPANLKGKVTGTPGEAKGLLWNLGDGDDRVVGVQARPNLFTYRDGTKTLTGGDKNDEFYYQVPEQELNRATRPAQLSFIDGGAGVDTLAFEGQRPLSDTRHVGYDVNLVSNKVKLRGLDPEGDGVEVAQLTAVENVSTLRKGTNRVTGNDQANQISANGYDRINAGAGDDTIAVRGPDCHVQGGSGKDRYYIADTNAQTTIVEDGAQLSLIEFGWTMDVIQRWEIVGTSLVVSSLRDRDGRSPLHELTLENVYQWIDGKRHRKNDQLLFKTGDGYELLPSLPALLDDSPSQDIEVAVSVKGRPAAAAVIVNNGTFSLTAQGTRRHFVSRAAGDVEFVAQRNAAETSNVIYLDFKHTEIISVGLDYEVQTRKGVSGNTHLTYKDLNLSIALAGKTVRVKGVIQTIAAATGYSGRNSLKVTTPLLAHDVALVLQDEVSWRLQIPDMDYEDDAKNPGHRTRSTRSCLKRRHGKYLFIQPQVTETQRLPAKNSNVDIAAKPHTGIYALEGQSCAYGVYLASNSIIRLSTPDALAKSADASTWTLFTRRMAETVTRDEIRLDANRLRIGSAVIELPDVPDDAPVESVSVATSAGNIYEVSLLFEVLQLYVINAQGYASVDELLADLRNHRERGELAARVAVTHIGAFPSIDGTVIYHTIGNYWGVESNQTLRIAPENLVITTSKTA